MTNAKINYLVWLWLAVFTAGLFFSFSRSAWLALAVGLIVMAALAVGRGNLKWQKGLAEIILVMGILSLIIFSQYQNLVVSRLSSQGRLENKSNFERLASFKESWQLIKNHWLLGVGPGNYTSALSRTTPGQVSYFYQPAHNVFLLVWAEVGIGGLLFFVGLIIFAFVRLPRRPEYGASRNDIQKFAVLSCLIILMSFDHWLFSLHFGVLFFWLILGLIYREKSCKMIDG